MGLVPKQFGRLWLLESTNFLLLLLQKLDSIMAIASLGVAALNDAVVLYPNIG